MIFQSVLLLAISFQFGPSDARISNRRLSFERIVGYQPTTQVTDHAAIDLDQQAMEDQLSANGDHVKAKNVYEQGGHSYSFAQLALQSPVGGGTWPVGTQVFGRAENGNVVIGTLLNGVQWPLEPIVAVYEVKANVLYTTSNIQANYVNCQVGGLYTFGAANREGCFNETGSVVFLLPGVLDASEGTEYPYEYDIRQENFNGRTLKRFSLQAAELMKYCPTCGFYSDYAKFVKYYGDYNYGDVWVTAAFDKTRTNFQSGRGNADFSTFRNKDALAEAISKGTAYMNLLMYVIRELEDALGDCNANCAIGDCNEAPVHALDEAVAFYAGSLEGKDGSGDGFLLYNLADKRALDFRTAGENSNEVEGTSHINIEIIREFQRAQLFLLDGNCPEAAINKEIIVNYMKVPLVQGALRYAYIRQFEVPSGGGLREKAEAEGAAFAAAVLPWVAYCDEADADLIYENLRVGSQDTDVNFAAVKAAFERTYKCLGISCGQVGGLWGVDGYKDGAKPCGGGASGVGIGSEDANAGVIVGGIFGAVAGLALLLFLWSRCVSKQQSTSKGSGNIAAVSEIS